MVGASSASAFGAVALAARSSTCTTPAGPNATTRPGGTTATAELHGVYAFIAVVEFWHGHVPGSFAFALRVRRLRLALDRLNTSRLTGAGRRLVDAVSLRLAVCEPVAASSDHADVVGTITADHLATRRVRHVRPHPEDVAALAGERLAEGRRSRRVRCDVVGTGAEGESRRVALPRMKARDREGGEGDRRVGRSSPARRASPHRARWPW